MKTNISKTEAELLLKILKKEKQKQERLKIFEQYESENILDDAILRVIKKKLKKISKLEIEF